MDRLKQAIAYFEDAIRESDEIISECSPDLQKELTEQKQHFVVALEALRRPAPENKPCELMTLDDAIAHCDDKSQSGDACGANHAQLRDWLTELKVLKIALENKPLTLDQFERICEAVHDGWWEEKKRQGVTDHPDMLPYDELSEPVKEYDRVTVRRVLDALGTAYARKPENES